MSLKENNEYIETQTELFYEYLQSKSEWDKCEAIVEQIKEHGFIDEALDLEGVLEEEVELKEAQERGSESGMDNLQD